VLNAVYPIGSVYICYSDNKLTTCPIANSLGGTWLPIDAGNFLVSASTSDGLYRYGSTGGSANTVAVTHTHTVTSGTFSTSAAGEHTHNFSFAATAHDASSDNCFRSANLSKGGRINVTQNSTDQGIVKNGSHSHTLSISGLTATDKDKDDNALSDGQNKNLPPYIAVYMWKRTA
jgi:hypothetical protein